MISLFKKVCTFQHAICMLSEETSILKNTDTKILITHVMLPGQDFKDCVVLVNFLFYGYFSIIYHLL